jgi:CHAT domain-containing protein
VLQRADVSTLVVIPDGPLRLIPFGVLHDGKNYLLERYAIAVAPGITMVNPQIHASKPRSLLLAGMSEPGDVVKKITTELLASIAEQNDTQDEVRGLSALRTSRALNLDLIGLRDAFTPEERALTEKTLKLALALPGVKDEVQAIGVSQNATVLMDNDFTSEHFRQQLMSGNFGTVHIASHGFFGGSAERSYLLASDDLISLTSLQSYLGASTFEDAPLDMLILSACQTAEGNDRAPLGFAGAAVKAHAQVAVGTLWPLSDDAAVRVMSSFYQGIGNGATSRIKALRQAQLALLHDSAFSHPFYWAPFVMVGNWR